MCFLCLSLLICLISGQLNKEACIADLYKREYMLECVVDVQKFTTESEGSIAGSDVERLA